MTPTPPAWPEPVRWEWSQSTSWLIVHDGKDFRDVVREQSALASAALARLEIAVEALREIADNPGYDNAYAREAQDALAAIGPLPSELTKERV